MLSSTIQGRNCRSLNETPPLFWNGPLLHSCQSCCFLGMAAFPTQLQVKRHAKEKLASFPLHIMREELRERKSQQGSQALRRKLVKILQLLHFVGGESHPCVDWLANSFAGTTVKCKYLWITVYVVILFPKQTLLCTVAPKCCELRHFPASIPFRAISCRE